MSAGLCMWSPSGHLILCNERYVQMYNLTPEVTRPGATLRQLLEHRTRMGNFSGDIDQYIADVLSSIAKGKTTTSVREHEGRFIALANRPMPDGGWVATHEDVTEQRQAELNHTSMLAAESRRTEIEEAIAGFRARVENVLKSVGDSANSMQTTAVGLLNSSEQTSQRAEERRALLQRRLGQRRDRRDRRLRAFGLDRRDQRATRAHDRRGARLGERSRDHQRADRRSCRGRAEDRRRGQADQRHRRADQPSRAQRHHRGRPRRRSRPRLRGGRLRGEVARGADRQSHRGDRRADPCGAGLDHQRGRGDPQHRRPHEGDQRLYLRGGRLDRAAEFGNRRDFAERRRRGARHRTPWSPRSTTWRAPQPRRAAPPKRCCRPPARSKPRSPSSAARSKPSSARSPAYSRHSTKLNPRSATAKSVTPQAGFCEPKAASLRPEHANRGRQRKQNTCQKTSP